MWLESYFSLKWVTGIDKAFVLGKELAFNTGESSSIPSGVICMWSGTVSSIPDDWVLCNGQNNTPDLRNRFVIGAGRTYAVNDIGGEAAHVLTVSEMPRHNHTIPKDSGGGGTYGGGKYCAKNSDQSSGAFATSSTGSGAAHNNLPPYYALCFIMKL